MPRRKVPFGELTLEYREELATRIALEAELVGECTLYYRHPSKNGYGRVSVKGVLQAAHRFLYQHYVDHELPEHIEVDHACHNRACIRVAHLTAVDRSENARRRRSHGFHHDGSTLSRRYSKDSSDA